MFKVQILALLTIVAHVKCNIAHGHSHDLVGNNRIEKAASVDDSVDYYHIGVDYVDGSFTDLANDAIEDRLERVPITGVAKNVIVFVGHNIPVKTIRRGRKYFNQCHAVLSSSNNCVLSTHFYEVALVKTECYDGQEGNPACTATAILTGGKVNRDTIAVDPNIEYCTEFEHFHQNKLTSIAAWAQEAGKRTGLVTTSQVTSPSVAPYYAHSCNAFWESDVDVPNHPRVRNADFAAQLVNGPTGRNLNVILGGGRRNFLPQRINGGVREDRRNLVKEWVRSKRFGGEYAYVETLAELWRVCIYTDYLFGLFNDGPLALEEDPSLADLTEVAIKVLNRPNEDNGYVLFVQEDDQGMYGDDDKIGACKCKIASALELIKAVRIAVAMTDEEETLIIFTTDYATDNVQPYDPSDFTPDFSSNSTSDCTLDFSSDFASDFMSDFTSSLSSSSSNSSSSLSEDSSFFSDFPSNLNDFPYVNDCDVRESGEDAFLFARGPWAHLFNTVMEQYWIARFIGYAACMGDGMHACDSP